MSTENSTGAAQGTAQNQTSGDSLKNLKEEMNRKIDNLAKQNEALLAALNKKQEPKVTETKEENLESLWYDDANKAAEKVITKAEERIMNKLSAQNAAQARQNEVLQEMFVEFPELGNKDSELTKKAVELYSQYGDSEKSSPISYKAAILQAAQELDMKPKSKRNDESDEYISDSDNFSIGGSGPSRPRSRGKRDIDPATEEFAQLVGVDLSDSKVRERIKSSHGRKKGYSRWE